MRKILYLIVCALFFGACSVPKEREVKVSNVDITGFIKDYVKVVDGTYKFTNTGDDAAITIKVELIKKPINYDTKSWNSIRLNAITSDDRIINTGTFGFVCYDTDRLEDLFKGNIGDTKNLSFTYEYFNVDNEDDKSIFTDAVSFELIDKAFEEEQDDMLSSTTYTSNESSDWDKVLSEYESFVDSYVKLIKKAQSGDVSALTESAEILTKANALSSKLSNAKGKMSASQVAKFVKLQSKIATAAM